MKYIEFEQDIDKYSINKLDEKLKHYKNAICRFAYIVHDKDINKVGDLRRPHFHCAIEFNEKTYTYERLSKMFDAEPQYFQKPKKKGVIGFNNVLGYLVHSTDGASEKYSYDPKDVIANFDYITALTEIQNKVKDTTSHAEKVSRYIYEYANFQMTKKQLFKALDFVDYDKNIQKINNATKYRNELSRNGERDMKVIYICGEAGSGKTTLAKFLANNLGFDYFVSGSGADLLDGYDNEEVIILDDLRGDAFNKAELFKLLDNNTGSAVKSRYYNKVINHCRILIITSIKRPYQLYDWTKDEENEPAKQFYRRLSYAYLYIDGDDIKEVAVDEEGKVKGEKPWDLTMPLVYAVLGIKSQNKGLASVMDEVSKSVRKKLEKQSKDLPF